MLHAATSISRTSRFLVVDRTLVVSALSRRAEQLFGVPEQSLLDRPISDLLAATDPDGFTATLHAAVFGDATQARAHCRSRLRPSPPLEPRIVHCNPPAGALLLFEP
jgi:PAS domain-containing protein